MERVTPHESGVGYHVGLRGVFEDEAMMYLAVADAIMQGSNLPPQLAQSMVNFVSPTRLSVTASR